MFHWFGIYAFIKGSPFVPTSSDWCNKILKEANLIKGKIFLEMGSGDGRLLRLANLRYGVKCIGLEINPVLIIYSRIITKFSHLNNISYIIKDFFKYDLSSCDYVYVYLLPKTIAKLTPKFIKECKHGTIIISHRFTIPFSPDKLIKVITVNDSNTYYYRL